VQNTLHKVIAACGIKKRSHPIAFAIIPHAGLCRTVGFPFPKMRSSWDLSGKLILVHSA
jgi:hypothetical protein